MAGKGSLSVETIGIVANVFKPDALSLVARLLAESSARGLRVLLDTDTGRHVPGIDTMYTDDELARQADIIIVLGGDGTLISVTKRFSPLNLPVMGVNLGKLGFLAEVSPDEIEAALEQLQSGHWSIEHRLMLKATVDHVNSEKDEEYLALNDFVIAREAFARVIDIQLNVDDRLVDLYRGDGLIVATPTGSTGYSLSAGGPVVFPLLKSILVTPICPHTIGSRPLVLSEQQTISARVWSGRSEIGVGLTIDGQFTTRLGDGDTLIVSRASFPALLVALDNKNFFEILHSKLKGRVKTRLTREDDLSS